MPGHGPFSYGYYPPNLLGDPGRSALPGHRLARFQLKMPGVPEGTAPDDGLISMPLIIPPVKAKAYDRFGGLFGTVWEAAEDLLARADQILILGYSFPRTDHRSLDLFAKAFRRRGTLPSVVIVDPAPDRALAVFRDILGVTPSGIRVLAERLSDDYPVEQILE